MNVLIFLIGATVGMVVSGILAYICIFAEGTEDPLSPKYLYVKYEIIPPGESCGTDRVSSDFADRMVTLHPDQYWIGM